ncbi:MAG: YCF48-related protein [bacterium]|nr:YCF48-related protein [bacterium]
MTKYNFILLSLLLLIGASCGEVADGGVFKSYDGGESWEQKTFISQEGRKKTTISDVNIATTVAHPNDSNIIYIGTNGNGMYTTLDGGETWVQSQINNGSVTSIAFDPKNPETIYVAKNTTIMKTVDGGETWENVYSDVKASKVNVIVVDSYDTSRIYASTSAGTIIKSYDYGINWDLHLQIENPVVEMLMAPYNTRIIYALTSEGVLYKTTNGGEALVTPDELDEQEEIDTAGGTNSGWDKLLAKDFKEKFDGAGRVYDVALDPNDFRIVYIVTSRGILRSYNEGLDWEDITTLIGFKDKQNKNIRHLTVAPKDSETIYFVVGKKIHVSTDNGNAWKTLESFPTTRSVTSFLIDQDAPNVIYIGTELVESSGGLIK